MRVPSASRTKQFPPEDQPSGQGLIPVSDSEIFADVLAHNTPDGPWAAGLLFHAALTHDDGPQLDLLRNLVTSESLAAWGDFSAAREHLADTGMTSRAEIPAPGVAYVKFLSDPGQDLRSDGDVMMMARAVATLQFRPESGRCGWRGVHRAAQGREGHAPSRPAARRAAAADRGRLRAPARPQGPAMTGATGPQPSPAPGHHGGPGPVIGLPGAPRAWVRVAPGRPGPHRQRRARRGRPGPRPGSLAASLGVSNTTVDRAYRRLAEQGVLCRVPGMGYYVSAHGGLQGDR
jgi:hypothetical protein